MLEASVELNRALQELVDLSKSLGELNNAKVCDINVESKIHASIKLLRVYELCVRIDESLRAVMTHKEDEEIKFNLDRSKLILNNLTEVVKSFNEKEKRLFLAYMQPDFVGYQHQLASILKKRPSERIWETEKLISVATDLSHAIESLRQSAARAMLAVSTSGSGDASKFFGELIC